MMIVDNDLETLETLIQGFTPAADSKYHDSLTIQKAGIWQGIDSHKDMNMLVVRDVNLYLDLNKNPDFLLKQIKPDLEWCDIHFKERISKIPLNPGESYKSWPYAKLKEGDGFIRNEIFNHTYMERFWPKLAGNVLGVKYDTDLGFNNSDKKFFNTDQPKPLDGTHPNNRGIRYEYGDLDDVIKQLKDNPLTRQAYLPIFFPEDTGSVGNLRVPCTLGYLFEIIEVKENNKFTHYQLDITYYIRSCDVLRHLRNDIYLAYLLAAYVLDQTCYSNVELGELKMKIANLHLFENDTYALVKKENKLKEIWNEKE